jgi:hypothetical protein
VKLRRGVVSLLAALLLLTALWIVGGNMWAARREERCDRAWTATFGSLDDLKKKYPKRETNETAKRVEVLAKDLGLDLAPSERTAGGVPRRLTPVEEKRGQAILDYTSAEIIKPEASIDAPPEEISRFFEEKSVGLDAIESLLVAGPPPQWSFDISRPESDGQMPNGSGHIRLQRALLARALASAQGSYNEAAARTLGASWNLNESLRGRPEMNPVILSIAIARLQVGTLRKVNVEEDVWRRRMAMLEPRTPLLDELTLEYRPGSARNLWSQLSAAGDSPSWYQRTRDFLLRPAYRLMMVDYSDLMREDFAQLRATPLVDHFAESSTPVVRDTAHIMFAISMPNTHNSLVRADRLVVDAELTSKILEAKRLRRENGGRWPAAIPGIETSRYPGASWRYEVSPDGARMSIAFSRELASPYGEGGPLKPLPLSFSSN